MIPFTLSTEESALIGSGFVCCHGKKQRKKQMKKLKFMLAAATAIGLASATQAAVDTYASTGFEKLTVGTNVTTGVIEEGGCEYLYSSFLSRI